MIEEIRSKLLSSLDCTDPTFQSFYEKKYTYIRGISMGGRTAAGSQSGSNMSDIRQCFTMNVITNSQILKSIWQQTPNDLHLIDLILNIHKDWPPMAVIHNIKDFIILFEMSEYLESQLQLAGVKTKLIAVPGEPHTFAGQMVKDSPTWWKQREGFDFLERILNWSYNNDDDRH